MQKRSKKGFTLAELLIVVAIIAVLVAIAVPLFVGALGKAEKRVEDANVRAVRGAAVVAILSDDKLLYANEGQQMIADYWTIDAEVNSNGSITKLTIKPSFDTTGEVKTAGDTLKAKKVGDGFTVTGNIVELKPTLGT